MRYVRAGDVECNLCFGEVNELPELRNPSETPFLGNARRVHPNVPRELFVTGFDATKASLHVR